MPERSSFDAPAQSLRPRRVRHCQSAVHHLVCAVRARQQKLPFGAWPANAIAASPGCSVLSHIRIESLRREYRRLASGPATQQQRVAHHTHDAMLHGLKAAWYRMARCPRAHHVRGHEDPEVPDMFVPQIDDALTRSHHAVGRAMRCRAKFHPLATVERPHRRRS